VLALIRRLARVPGFRLLTRSRLAMRLSASLRCSLVRESVAFVANELRRRDVLSQYHLRRSGVAICLRHHSPDVFALDQGFSQDLYEIGPHSRAALARLGRPLEVVDLGANIGLFCAYVLGELEIKRLIAFEPDHSNAQVLARAIQANEREDSWELVEACAATADGALPFISGRFGMSRVAAPESGEGATVVPALDVFPYLEHVDLLKIDIEGGEWSILADPRFRRLPASAILLEYHRHLCPDANPRELAGELLAGAGYEVELSADEPEEDLGTLRAWKPVSARS
jgi:FkbM family methyltransferase